MSGIDDRDDAWERGDAAERANDRIEELEAEVAKLKALLVPAGAVVEPIEYPKGPIKALEPGYVFLRSPSGATEIQRLRAVVDGWAEHKRSCPSYEGTGGEACTCGLREALK